MIGLAEILGVVPFMWVLEFFMIIFFIDDFSSILEDLQVLLDFLLEPLLFLELLFLQLFPFFEKAPNSIFCQQIEFVKALMHALPALLHQLVRVG